jgi:hypothetical protein
MGRPIFIIKHCIELTQNYSFHMLSPDLTKQTESPKVVKSSAEVATYHHLYAISD